MFAAMSEGSYMCWGRMGEEDDGQRRYMSIPEAVSQKHVHSIDSEAHALIMNTLITFVCVHRIQSIDTVSLIEWHGKVQYPYK